MQLKRLTKMCLPILGLAVLLTGLSGKRWIWDWPDRKEGL